MTIAVKRTRPAKHESLTTVALLIGAAWAVAILVEATGRAAALHHHALIEHGPPPLVALASFSVAWVVMVAAMMLPSSLPAVRALVGAASARPRADLAGFLAAYAAVWLAFGVGAFFGDVALHRIVDATPWLAERPWLIEAGLFGVAGAYQLLPIKHRWLDACRHPSGTVAPLEHQSSGGVAVGVGHALDCVASSWPLMLLMFAAGVASLGWMVVLTVAMTYETVGRHGHRAATAFGVLLLLAGLAVLSGWSPGLA